MDFVEGNDSNKAGSELKIGSRFSQFCDKIRINVGKDFYKDISASFTKYQ